MNKNIIRDISILSIIKLKLNLIFKYTNEEDTLEQFEKIISEYEEESSWVENLLIEFTKINNNLDKKAQIDTQNHEKNEAIIFMKASLDEYKTTRDPLLLTAILEKYKDVYIPLQVTLRSLQYYYYDIEYDDILEEYKLIKIPRSIASVEQIMESEPKIISNIQ